MSQYTIPLAIKKSIVNKISHQLNDGIKVHYDRFYLPKMSEIYTGQGEEIAYMYAIKDMKKNIKNMA